MTPSASARPNLSRADVEAGGKMIDDSAISLLRLIHDDIRALHDRQGQQDRRQDDADQLMKAHIVTEEKQFDAILSAFPDGPDAHREAHQAMINAAKAQEKFWSELRLDVAKKGIWGLMVIICGLVLTGAAAKLGIRP